MSEENVEIVRTTNAAYASGDIQRALETLDEESEWRETWERLKLDCERYIDAGDRVVVFVHEVARGARAASRPRPTPRLRTRRRRPDSSRETNTRATVSGASISATARHHRASQSLPFVDAVHSAPVWRRKASRAPSSVPKKWSGSSVPMSS